MPASTATPLDAPAPAARTELTLLDLVSALGETGATDREVVASVMDLLTTGRVRLVGRIRGEQLLAR
ncbi:MAG: hypothetical protein ACQGVK_16160 [Myxococcota bacterium]